MGLDGSKFSVQQRS